MIRRGLAPTQYRYVFAHECAHAYFHHTGIHLREEFQADIFAAKLLIHPHQYQQSVQFYDDPLAVADDLGVMPHLVRLFHKHCFQSRGLPPQGAGYGE